MWRSLVSTSVFYTVTFFNSACHVPDVFLCQYPRPYTHISTLIITLQINITPRISSVPRFSLGWWSVNRSRSLIISGPPSALLERVVRLKRPPATPWHNYSEGRYYKQGVFLRMEESRCRSDLTWYTDNTLECASSNTFGEDVRIHSFLVDNKVESYPNQQHWQGSTWWHKSIKFSDS